jgi:hypothetical protein
MRWKSGLTLKKWTRQYVWTENYLITTSKLTCLGLFFDQQYRPRDIPNFRRRTGPRCEIRNVVHPSWWSSEPVLRQLQLERRQDICWCWRITWQHRDWISGAIPSCQVYSSRPSRYYIWRNFSTPCEFKGQGGFCGSVRPLPHNKTSTKKFSDFFNPQNITADVYYFRNIFHNWADKYAIKILRNLTPALRKGARVIIHDRILPAFDDLNTLDAERAM